MSLPNKYDFSFTAASLRLPEMIMVARHMSDGKKVDYVNDIGTVALILVGVLLLYYRRKNRV